MVHSAVLVLVVAHRAFIVPCGIFHGGTGTLAVVGLVVVALSCPEGGLLTVGPPGKSL